MKQSRKISSYFLPLHHAPSRLEENENQPVPLNGEQRKVLEMVVDEGKNVFFTGAAGARHIHSHPATQSSVVYLAFLVGQAPGNRYYSGPLFLRSGGST